MIEFAFVTPLLLLLAFGTAEMGMAWVADNRVEGSVSTAARIGASSGDVVEADLNIIRSLKSSLPQEQLDNLDRVVVFKAATATGGVPANCIKPVGSTDETGVDKSCNTYSGATVRGTLPTDPATFTTDSFWDPLTERNADLSDPGGPHYIGVWIRTRYSAATGTFFDDMAITTTSVYRIQP